MPTPFQFSTGTDVQAHLACARLASDLIEIVFAEFGPLRSSPHELKAFLILLGNDFERAHTAQRAHSEIQPRFGNCESAWAIDEDVMKANKKKTAWAHNANLAADHRLFKLFWWSALPSFVADFAGTNRPKQVGQIHGVFVGAKSR